MAEWTLAAVTLLLAAARLVVAAIAGEGCRQMPCSPRCCRRGGSWKARIRKRLSVHGGDGRSAHCPKLDGNVAYVDGSVNFAGQMGAGAFFGVGHVRNFSAAIRRPTEARGCCHSCSCCCWRWHQRQPQAPESEGDPNVAELAALLMVLLQHPRGEKLTVCTDSAFVLRHLRHLLDASHDGGDRGSHTGKHHGQSVVPRGWSDQRFLP